MRARHSGVAATLLIGATLGAASVACNDPPEPRDSVDAGPIAIDGTTPPTPTTPPAPPTPTTPPTPPPDPPPPPAPPPPPLVEGKLDALFVIDGSNSMAEEQNNLAANFGTFVRALVTGDHDGDGTAERRRITDLHLGVISVDLGTAGFPVPTCSDDGDPDGDDGVLITRGNTMVMGCSASYPSFLTFEPGADADALVQQLGCVARLGTGGCGFEQQLEATLKALTPSTSTSVAPFVSGTGHADGANAGFRRDDAMLAIVMLTDEEDCSAQNPEIFNSMSGIFPGEALNLRCFMYGAESYGAVQPVERYVSGFVAAAHGDPSRLVFAPIIGVPPDSVPDPTSVDFDAVLAHPNMQEMIDPMDPNRLRASCNVPGLGIAFPPRRIVEVARRLDRAGAAVPVSSICRADLDLRTVARTIADRAGAR